MFKKNIPTNVKLGLALNVGRDYFKKKKTNQLSIISLQNKLKLWGTTDVVEVNFMTLKLHNFKTYV